MKIFYLLGESSQKPDERLFELVIALGRNVVVLEVLLSVESDLLGFYLSVLNIDFVTDQDNWNVFTNSDKILVPLRNILIGDS